MLLFFSETLRHFSTSFCVFSGGYYTLSIKGTNLDAVVLNTNLYYENNDAVDVSGDPAGQFQWLEEVLTNITASNRKASEVVEDN